MKVRCRKLADQSTSAAGTLVDCDDMQFQIAANRTYVFRFWVDFTTGATDQIQFSINGPAGPQLVMFGGNMFRTVLAGPAHGNQITYNTIIRLSTTAEATSRTALIEGIVVNGATAGLLTLRFQSESGGGGAAVTVLANSRGELDDRNIPAPGGDPDWMWAGGVTSTTANIAFRTPALNSSAFVTAYAPTTQTTLSSGVASGNTVFPVVSVSGFLDGDQVCLREGHNVEYKTIAAGGVGASSLTFTVASAFTATTACEAIRMTGITGIDSTVVSSEATTDQRVIVALSGLTANTRYFYRTTLDGNQGDALFGWFKTMPPEFTAANFVLAVGACSNETNATVYQRISDKNPLMFIHMGDLNYIAPTGASVTPFRTMYSTVLSSINNPNQSELFRHQASMYDPDDQDGPVNDGDSTSAGVAECQLAFRENVPSYTLTDPTGIYESGVVGRLLVIKSINRLERSPKANTDNASKIMWSSTQVTWFGQQLDYANANNLGILWICSNPYEDVTTAGGDSWGGYTFARKQVADLIASKGCGKKIFICSGDMHAICTKIACTDYSTAGTGASFPIFQMAAMGQAGNVKGGPYDQTPFQSSAGNGQYGVVTVTDNGGSTISVRVQGKSSTDTDLTDNTITLTLAPAMSWLPVLPTAPIVMPPAPVFTGAVQPFNAALSTVLPFAWLPELATMIAVAVPEALGRSVQPFTAALSAPTVVPLSWSPQLSQVQPPPGTGPPSATVSPPLAPTLPAPALSWLPKIAPAFALPIGPDPDSGAIAPVLVPSAAAPLLSWQPILAPTVGAPAWSSPSSSVGPVAPVGGTAPLLSWEPRRTVSLPPAPPDLAARTFAPVAPVGGVAPLLAWAPVLAPTPPGPITAATSQVVGPLSPALPAPFLSWSPKLALATFVPPPAPVAGSVGPLVTTAPVVVPLSWAPRIAFPVALPAGANPDSGSVAPVLVQATPASPLLAWAPKLAPQTFPPVPGQTAQAVGPILPALPIPLVTAWSPTLAYPLVPAPVLTGASFVAPLVPLGAAAVPALSWAPRLAPPAPPTPPPAIAQAVGPVAPVQGVAPLLAWAPAGGPPVPPVVPVGIAASVGPLVVAASVPPLSWAPRLALATITPALAASINRFAPVVVPPPPILAWAPKLAPQVFPPVGILPTGFATKPVGTPPPPPATPPLSWAPRLHLIHLPIPPDFVASRFQPVPFLAGIPVVPVARLRSTNRVTVTPTRNRVVVNGTRTKIE